jgi:hypothetical protein
MKKPYSALMGLLLATGCVNELDPGPLAAELRSDPSIMVMSSGETKTVIVEAFLGNQPESVAWNIGTVGAGLEVTEDSTYGTVFDGNELVLPPQSHSRRYEVTMNSGTATSFVISGGTGTITIPVNPPAP